MRAARLATGVLLAAAAAAVSGGTPSAALAAFPATPPNDPLFDASPLPNATNEQWNLASPFGGFDRGISVDRAWKLTTGEGATVAVLDVGVNPGHPDLKGRFTGGYDFYARDGDPTSDTRNPHGTQVASVLGATADNGIGIAGIAPGARIMPLRTSDNIIHQGRRLAEAIVYAADRGVDVISASLGADSFPASLRRAVTYASRKGTLVVVASGNEFAAHHHWPQIADEALAVGGLNPDTANAAAFNENAAIVGGNFRTRAQYSDYGPHLDVVAPTQVPAATWDGFTKTWSGTSAATPHVAGVATLIASRARALGMKLRPGEIVQIIRMTADDVNEAGTGEAAGWDRLTGWGRVNAEAAVRRVAPATIPPETDITSPGWYEPRRGGSVAVKGVVRGRSAVRWVLESGRGEEPPAWTRVASGSGSAVRAALRLGAGGWTLRLRATDANGNAGEDRAYFRVLGDRTLAKGFPIRLGTSGEASPALADLDRDRVPEIVLATSDGLVRAYRGKGGRSLPGFPVAMKDRAGAVSTPAVGDVTGDKRPEIVVGGLDGRLYAWDARGRKVRGFPVRIDARRPLGDGRRDAAIYASPALADLDADGRLDIVVGAADQKVYAWNGRGRRLKGWPVLARDSEDAKILSSPAVGDINGDGKPDVVEGTAEAYGTTPAQSGRVYAWTTGGRLLPGWPIKPGGLSTDGIPLAGEGVPASPSLGDVDGDGADEVAISAFTGAPELYKGDGSIVPGPAGAGAHFDTAGRGASSKATAPSVLALGASLVFGRTSPGGPLRIFGGLVDFRLAQAQLSPATPTPFEHLFGGWDAASGRWLPGFPAPVEGWTLLTAPAVADVDGDGRSEAIAGSSGNVLHAFREDGSEPAGWPKQTEGWLLASPAVGDVDGDGRREVVAVTRDGWLFAWDTPARATAPADWPSFRHDPRNTGRWRR
jgi:subtilisin family serine protease